MRIYPASIIARLKQFRKKGYSIEKLMREFKMPKTSIWHHVHSIKIPEKYAAKIRHNQGGSRLRKDRDFARAREEASMFVPDKIDKKMAAILASILYWGEGAKRDFNLANSDPNLIRLFMNCMGKLGISPEKFALHVRTYEDLDTENAIRYWLAVTGIPKSNIVRVEVLQGRKEGKLPYGMCRIRLYKGAYQLKFLTAIREHIIKLV